MSQTEEIQKLLIKFVGDNSEQIQAIQEASREIDKYSITVDGRLKDARGKFTSASKIMSRLMGEVGDSADKENVRLNRFSSTISIMERAAKKANIMLGKIGSSITNIGNKAQAAGRSLSLHLTAPIVAMGTAAVASFTSFDKAMTESTAIMQGIRPEQIEQMRKQAIELGTKGGIGPTKLAEAYFFLASAGKDAAQSMALLPSVSEFAAAGNFEMALATDLLTDSQSALGLSMQNAAEDAKQMARLSNALVKANTMANATVQQFAEAIGNDAGSQMKAYNIELEQGLAVLAAYADQSKKGAEAGTLMGRMLRLLVDAQAENAEAFKEMGITIFDTEGNFRDMSLVIKDFENALGDLTAQQKAAALEQLGFSALTQKSILPLLGTSEAIARYAKGLEEAGEITKEVANNNAKSLSAQFSRLKNRAFALGIQLGEILAPHIEKLVIFIGDWIDKFRNLNPETQAMIIKIGAVVAAIGPMVIIIGKVISGVGMMITGFKILISILGAVLAPILTVKGAIALLVAAVLSFALPWDKVWLKIKAFFSGVMGFFYNFRENMGILTSWLKDNWKEALIALAMSFKRIFELMPSYALSGLKILIRSYSAFSGWLFKKFKDLFTIDTVIALKQGLVKMGELIYEWGKSVAGFIFDALTGKTGNQLAEFAKTASQDAAATASGEDLTERLKTIINEELANAVNPLETIAEEFKNQGAELPQFNLNTQAVELTSEDLPSVIDSSSGIEMKSTMQNQEQQLAQLKGLNANLETLTDNNQILVVRGAVK